MLIINQSFMVIFRGRKEPRFLGRWLGDSSSIRVVFRMEYSIGGGVDGSSYCL